MLQEPAALCLRGKVLWCVLIFCDGLKRLVLMLVRDLVLV